MSWIWLTGQGLSTPDLESQEKEIVSNYYELLASLRILAPTEVVPVLIQNVSASP